MMPAWALMPILIWLIVGIDMVSVMRRRLKAYQRWNGLGKPPKVTGIVQDFLIWMVRYFD